MACASGATRADLLLAAVDAGQPATFQGDRAPSVPPTGFPQMAPFKDPFAIMDPGAALRVLRDVGGRMTLEQVIAAPPVAWVTPRPGAPTSYGFTTDAFWLRFTMESGAPSVSEVVVDLENPRLEKVDWYAVRGGEVLSTGHGGHQSRHLGPSLPSRTPLFAVRLVPGEPLEVLARVESRSSMYLPVRVYGGWAVYGDHAARHDWLALSVVGFTSCLFSLCLVLGFTLRSRLHRLNALIALLLCAYFLIQGGYWSRLGLPFGAWLAMYPMMLLVVVLDAVVGLFSLEFLPGRFRDRLPGRLLKGLLVLHVPAILVMPFLPFHWVFVVSSLICLLMMATATFVAWWLNWLQSGTSTRLLGAAWFIDAGIALMLTLEFVGAIPLWLPPSMGLAVYGVMISGLFLAASTQQAYDLMRQQVDASRLEQNLAEARLLALRYQVNPHFLYNAINSAIGLVQRTPARATPFLYRLADFLEAALRPDTSPTVTLEQEVNALAAYLDVEKVRFEERLEVHLDFPEELRACRVPELILQPLVENAFKHGFQQSVGPLRLRIRAFRSGDELRLEVANTGRLGAATSQTGGRRGLGLKNLRERLQILYGSEARVELEEREGWVVADLHLPARPEPPAASPGARR